MSDSDSTIGNLYDSIGNFFSQSASSSSVTDSSSSSSLTTDSGGFLSSNSYIGNFAFLLLVIFIFVILINIAINVMMYFTTTKKSNSSVKLVSGMNDASQLVVINQDPSITGSKTIYRSNNASDGIEFTWSIWMYINDLTYNSGKYKCVFYKGNEFDYTDDNQGLNFPNNAPGVYIAPNTNKLLIFMNTFNVINEEIKIDDIPLNKWMNLIIRCENNKLDIYINGTIIKSHQLHGVPKQNYGNVYVAPNGGFSGYISDLTYYNYALDISEIQNINSSGPTTTSSSTTANPTTNTDTSYLSFNWFSNSI